MQISAANLLAAAQQAARQVQQPQPKAFSAVLASENSKDDLFAPLDFKQTAAPTAPRPAAAQPARMGSQLDIRI